MEIQEELAEDLKNAAEAFKEKIESIKGNAPAHSNWKILEEEAKRKSKLK